MKLLFILAKFITPSEIFIYRDIQNICVCGAQAYIYSLRKSRGTSAEYPDIHVITLKHLFFSHVHWFLLNPYNYIKFMCGVLLPKNTNFKAALLKFKYSLKIPSLALRCLELKIEHIHAHFAYLPADVAQMLSEVTHIPYSVSVHGWDLFVEGKGISRRIVKASHIVCCNDYYARYIKNKLKIRSEIPVVVIRHGLNLDDYKWKKAGQAKSPFLIIAAGRFVVKKGLVYLFEACQILRNRGIDFKVMLYGEGPLESQYHQCLEQLKLKDIVSICSWLHPVDFRKKLAEADVFILPSIVAPDGDLDGIPNTLVEALALGTPSIASSVSAIPEMIIDGETGMLVEEKNANQLAEKIVELCTGVELRKKISEQARQLVERDCNGKTNALKHIEQFSNYLAKY